MNGFAALATLAAAVATSAGPAMFAYHVQPHESLSQIGARGLSPPSAYRRLLGINHLRDADQVRAGDTLSIPYALLRTTPIMATLEAFRGAVEIDGSGPPAKLIVGAKVGEGEVVATGEGAFARLSLPDGSHIALPSNSRIRFDRLRVIALTGALDRVLSLQKGRAESTVTPMTDPASRYVISTPVAVTSVRGTVFRAAFDPADNHESAGVLKGTVSVANARTASTAQVNEGVTATTQGVSRPKALLPAPTLAHTDFPQTDDDLKFEIVPTPGAEAYRLTVAADEAIAAPLLEKLAEGPMIDAPGLPDGAYYAQLSAIAPDGLEGLAAVYPFYRLRAGLRNVTVSKDGAGYLFKWEATGDAPATYRFELRRTGDAGPPLIDETALTEPRFAVKILPAGSYRWRVTAVRKRDGRRVETWFDPQALQVDR